MIFGLYSIRDVKTGFLTPVAEQSKEVAVRNFAHAVKRADSLFFTFANDYSLYKIAEYDSDSGLVKSLVCPEHVADATEFVKED